MAAKHTNAPWYRSQLGIDCELPEELFRAKAVQSSDPPSTEGASIPASAPAIPDDDVEETLSHVDDATDEDFIETDTGIGRYTLPELRKMFQFLPSDLRKYEYFGGWSWIDRRVRAGYSSIPPLFAAVATAGIKEPEEVEPEEGE